MTNQRAILLVVFAVIVFSAGSAMAGKRQCAEDYRRFCSQWGLRNQRSRKLHAPARRLSEQAVRQRTDPGRCGLPSRGKSRRAALGR